MSHKIGPHSGNDKRGDLRVKRTELMVQQAFMDLVVEIGFSAITVQMLAERAMINRATFYRHYHDIYDLAEKIYSTLSQEYGDSVEAYMPGSPIETLQCLFEHCGKYRAYYLALLSEMPRSQEFVRGMIEEETASFFARLGLDEASMSMPLPIVLRCWSSMQMGLVQWWLESDQQVSAKEMAECLWQLLEGGPMVQFKLPAHNS